MSKASGEQFNFQRRSGKYTLYGFANGRVDFLPAGAKDHDYRSDEQRAEDDAKALRVLERAEIVKCPSCGGIKTLEWYVSGGSNGEFKDFSPCGCASSSATRHLLRRITRGNKNARGGKLREYLLNHDKIGVDI